MDYGLRKGGAFGDYTRWRVGLWIMNRDRYDLGDHGEGDPLGLGIGLWIMD
jgi:hypothetical protein